MIQSHPDFELITHPTLSLLTYRVNPQEVQQQVKADPSLSVKFNEKLDKLTVYVQKQQREAGKSFVSRTRMQTQAYGEQTMTVFRVVLANPLTTENDLQNILDEQIAIASKSQNWAELTKDVV